MDKRKGGLAGKESVSDLYRQIFKILNTREAAPKILSILELACKYFNFACGFVYEANYRREFLLRENHCAYPDARLPKSFMPEDIFNSTELGVMLSIDKAFYNETLNSDRIAKKFADFFGARALFIMPVTASTGGLAGFVGICDRRVSLMPADGMMETAAAVCAAAAELVKIRYYESALSYYKESFGTVLNHTGIEIYVTDIDTCEILYANEKMAAPYGGPNALLGKKCRSVLGASRPCSCNDCDQQGGESHREWDFYREEDGKWLRAISGYMTWTDGRRAQVISCVDITEKKLGELTIEKMAFYDTLTGLPNRRKLEQDFAEFKARGGSSAIILFMDLDGFKEINDNMGHTAGDEFLSLLAAAFNANPLLKGKTYRYGGDEFIIFAEGDRAAYERLTEAVNTVFAADINVQGKRLNVGASIGLAYYPENGSDYLALLDCADKSMYRMKFMRKSEK